MKRRRTGHTLHKSRDVISNLPEDVMNLILMNLPITDAVRTSILSKTWRYKWVHILDVVFDTNSFMKAPTEKELAHAVDQVFFRHVGPILKFKCAFNVPTRSLIDRWIVHLSRNGIEKLILPLGDEKDYNDVPSSIFSCPKLCNLELFYCIFKVPPTFKGFHNLKVLNLIADISEATIEFLVSNSPVLEWLRLKTDRFLWCVKIHAPNLIYLDVHGMFRDLSLGSSPLLTDVSFYKLYRPSYVPPECRGDRELVDTCSFIQFMGCFHGIETLSLNGHFLQFLCLGDIPKKLSAPYEHLKYLKIDIALNPKELLATLCLLRSSPNLKELVIYYWSYGRDHTPSKEAEFWGAETQFDFLLPRLQIVEIIGLTKSFNLEFIRYILSSAPVLQTMKIRTKRSITVEEVARILTELFRFRRASTRAECIYLGHDEIYK